MTKLPSAILFDNDGILVDTERLYYQATRDIFLELGIEISPEQFREHFLVNAYGTWHLLQAAGFGEDTIAQLREQRNSRYSELLRTESIAIPGVDSVLVQLSKKYRLCVVTSSRRDHFELEHSRTGFAEFFEFAVTADDVSKTKPDPELYLLALQRLGLPREDCLVIEDSERGLRAAVAAGLRCWVIPTSLTQGSDFSAAERVVISLAEAAELLTEG